MQYIKTLTEADYDAIFSLSQFAFQYEMSEEEMLKKQEEAGRHIMWGWMDEDKLAAKLHVIPLSCYINGKVFEMGGISSVATWPEYRRQGMVKELLYHALNYMKENGQSLSFLHPFSFPFYRKYGWEQAFTEQHYAIPLEKLKKNWNPSGYVRRIQPDIPLLHQIYTDYAKGFNGMLVRDEAWWKQRVLTKKYQIAVAYNEQDQPEGYVLYDVKDSVFKVKEMIYCNLNGWQQLLQFISNHDSMAEQVKLTVPENDKLPLLLDEPRFEQKMAPYFMARIVDVQRFLQEYPFQHDGNFSIEVTDDFFPDNSGIYRLHITDGGANVEMDCSDNDTACIHCSVQVLTGVLLSFKRPKDYHQVGLLQGDSEVIDQLEGLIPDRQTFLTDFF